MVPLIPVAAYVNNLSPFQDRVILGTDYPFPLGEVLIADAYPGKVIKESNFSNDIKVSAMHIFVL